MNSRDALSNPLDEHEHQHRSRLLQALARVSVEKGLAAVTIADIVREAGVSKRTFYEYFDSKDSCFLALYRAANASALRTLREAVRPDRPWSTQVEHALHAYFTHLSAGPGLIRVLFIDIHHLGQAGISLRREVMQQLADFMVLTVNGGADPAPATPVQALNPALALAAVGAINELVLDAIERGAAGDLPSLAPHATAVIHRLARL